MKKVENWIEKQGSINTFNKTLYSDYLNKTSLKKRRFYLNKYKPRAVSTSTLKLNNYFNNLNVVHKPVLLLLKSTTCQGKLIKSLFNYL